MLFSSVIFLFLFLPLVFGLYFLLPSRAKNFFLLLASLFFYTWGEKEIVIVLIVTTLADYYYSHLIEKGYRKLGLFLSVFTNLSFLGFFKYFNFAFENFQAILNFFGINHPSFANIPTIILPIGISFYTFQTMSYTIDVYKGRVKASRNIIDYAAFVTMFPQLVAGPIVRYADIASQLKKKNISLENFTLGLQRFIIGLAKKMLIANSFAELADTVFMVSPADLSPGILWIGIIAYVLQLYFDFSGYSDMAIGLGRMLGFRFLENFNYPYISRSIREMWRRWHISLSTWFRDYLYIPLGGNRRSTPRVYFNLVVVFAVTGLWHGASWNFVIWGLFNGALIIIERLGFSKILKSSWLPLQHFYTMLAWVLSFVLFRSPDLAHAGKYYYYMFSFSPGDQAMVSFISYFHFDTETMMLFILAIILCMPVYPLLENRLTRIKERNIFSFVSINILKIIFYSALFIASVSYLSADAYNPFIYFRF
ncbi:MAG: MBOAT family protein [Bacteroidetes bacterium]|nr:MAG: MBOAT family protein [Bacteroidota bacterium]RLD62490.1 MAG: MBOAT family protein [Bacteroidota bacterium]